MIISYKPLFMRSYTLKRELLSFYQIRNKEGFNLRLSN